MESLNRLFGKEISNLVDNDYLNKHRNRNNFGLNGKIRGISIDDINHNASKVSK
jgi:hypothetical protein